MGAYSPHGVPNSDNLKLRTVTLSVASDSIPDGHVSVQILFISVDPYLRTRLTGTLCIQQYQLNEAITAYAVGKVIGSKDSKYTEGDHVVIPSAPVAEYCIIPSSHIVRKIDTDSGISLPDYLSALAKSSNHHSPSSAPSTAQHGEGNSPTFPQKNLPSPWAQVVRGSELESAASIHQSPPSSSSLAADQAPPSECFPKVASALTLVESSNTVGVVTVVDSSDGPEGNVDCSKKPVWNKPSNGVVVETGPVMGAESWPALSESTKASAKLPAESASKTVADGSLSTSQAPITLRAPQKQVTTNAKANLATNYVSNRPRAMKRVGGSSIGSGPSQSNFLNPPPPPPPPPFPVYQLPPVSYGNMVAGVPDAAPRDHYRNNNWDVRPIVGGFIPVMNEYRASSRRGYFGPHPRGDDSYHNSYGSRRDHDRGNYVNTRDVYAHQPRMPPRGLLKHPSPSTAAFVRHQPIGPFANPMGFSEFYYYQPVTVEHFPGMPFFTPSPPPTTYFSAAESPLSNMIVHQIEYYFSDANLVRDQFLRSQMDEQGWVSVTLIADFPRVSYLHLVKQYFLDLSLFYILSHYESNAASDG
ncbi:La-related protein 1C, partial [Mucuna pruriens]